MNNFLLDRMKVPCNVVTVIEIIEKNSFYKFLPKSVFILIILNAL